MVSNLHKSEGVRGRELLVNVSSVHRTIELGRQVIYVPHVDYYSGVILIQAIWCYQG